MSNTGQPLPDRISRAITDAITDLDGEPPEFDEGDRELLGRMVAAIVPVVEAEVERLNEALLKQRELARLNRDLRSRRAQSVQDVVAVEALAERDAALAETDRLSGLLRGMARRASLLRRVYLETARLADASLCTALDAACADDRPTDVEFAQLRADIRSCRGPNTRSEASA